MTQLTSPDTGVTVYSYDTAGNRTQMTDARGVTSTYTYDALNRPDTLTYADSSLNVTYSYDDPTIGNNGIGRLTGRTDESGFTAYTYDERGNMTGGVLTTDVGGTPVTFTTSYTYELADRIDTCLLYTSPSPRDATLSRMPSSA